MINREARKCYSRHTCVHNWVKWPERESDYKMLYNVETPCDVGPCHHGMARPQVADGGTASDMEGSCE